MVIGERLKKLRQDMGKTLKEQGETFGVSLNSIYRWEHGISAPRKATLEKMADYYGVSPEWLLGAQSPDRRPDTPPYYESDVEYQLLKMFRKLPDIKKYKILGYVERTYVEEMDKRFDPDT